MEMDFTPRSANNKLVEGEAGSYHSWSGSEMKVLGENKVGGGILVLKPGGFAFPHYADCSKVGYVLQGEQGSTGFVFPKNKTRKGEFVFGLQTGDVIPVPVGVTSWWYNRGNSDLVIVFIGETSNAYNPGEFTYFLLTGSISILSGFSIEFICKAFKLSEKEAKILRETQTQPLIIKLSPQEGENMPKPDNNHENKSLVKNICDFSADDENVITVQKAGRIIGINGVNFPFLKEVGLSCDIVKLDANAMLSPRFSIGPTVEVFYAAKGRGNVEVVGLNGRLVLDTKFESGKLLVVPRYFAVAITAGGEGMELFSIITTAIRPAMAEISSKESIMNALSPSVLQSSLNLPSEFIKLLEEKMAKNQVLIPPMV